MLIVRSRFSESPVFKIISVPARTENETADAFIKFLRFEERFRKLRGG